MTTIEGEKTQGEGADLDLTPILFHDRGQGLGRECGHDPAPIPNQNQIRLLVLIHQEEGSHLSKQQFSFLWFLTNGERNFLSSSFVNL